MNRCGFCGKPVSIPPDRRPEEDHIPWHTGCTGKFFHAPEVPEIDINTETLEALALKNVQGGITIGGVQKKLALHLEKNRNLYRLTLTGHPAGYILKPGSADYPELPEMEHTVMSLADLAEIPTVPHGLISLASGETAYITRRIDRILPASPTHSGITGKVPMEDFCQLSGRLTEDKYKGSCEQGGKIIARYSARPGLDLAEYYYRILFCFITGNADMHLKNFSLLRSPIGWVLSPAYDLLSTRLLLPEDKEETALTLNGKKSRLSQTDFTILGKSLGLPEKVIRGLMRKLTEKRQSFFTALEDTFLSEPRRAELTALITERAAMLEE